MDRLGYDEYFAEGGDLGAAVTDEMAVRRPPGLRGIHLTFAMFAPTAQERQDATSEEQRMLDSADYFWNVLSGYAKEQSTRPQTIGYSIADSPDDRRLELHVVPGHLRYPVRTVTRRRRRNYVVRGRAGQRHRAGRLHQAR